MFDFYKGLTTLFMERNGQISLNHPFYYTPPPHTHRHTPPHKQTPTPTPTPTHPHPPTHPPTHTHTHTEAWDSNDVYESECEGKIMKQLIRVINRKISFGKRWGQNWTVEKHDWISCSESTSLPTSHRLHPLSANITKWSKHTQTICRQIADELFECVRQLCGIDA